MNNNDLTLVKFHGLEKLNKFRFPNNFTFWKVYDLSYTVGNNSVGQSKHRAHKKETITISPMIEEFYLFDILIHMFQIVSTIFFSDHQIRYLRSKASIVINSKAPDCTT